MSQMGMMFETDREPYRLPTMEELRAVPWNGLTAVGSFSGCGGSSTGMRMAGWRVPLAIEFVPAAAQSYRANSSAFVDERDIRKIKGEEILERIGMDVGELDCFEGSPPCSSFSAAGSGQKDWGKTKKYSDTAQQTDDLFFEYIRLIKEMRPRSFVAENVPGLIRGAAVEAYAHEFHKLMSRHGYRVWAAVLNAAAHGAAQDRDRLIFIGVRNDEGVWPDAPPTSAPIPAYSIQEALDLVEELRPPDHLADRLESSMEGKAVGRTWHAMHAAREAGREPDFRTLPCDRCGKAMEVHRVRVQRRGAEILLRPAEMIPGDTTADIVNGKFAKAFCEDGGKAVLTKDYFMSVLPDPDAPCPTITATGSQVGAASVMHPHECRKLTPREALIISGFPVDFELVGTREQRYERVGRAVPPPLYRGVGAHLARLLGA